VIATAEITGIILAGGDGQRMGGVTKSLLVAAGSPLIAHVLTRLAPQVGTIVISANQEPAAHGRCGHEVVADSVPGLGPLGGLLTVLEHVATRYAFCCPGDSPLLSTTLVDRLACAMQDASADAALPSDGHRQQHLFMLLRTGLRESLRDYLAGGGRSVHAWSDTVHPVVVDCSDAPDAFLNVNTDADLVRVERLLAPIEEAS
jgi:molybdopterin-guanine dinucleotide biosynthesis protein A